MFRPKALLAAAAMLVGVSAANADYLTQIGSFTPSFGVPASTTNTTAIQFQRGVVYTNTYSTTTPQVGSQSVNVFGVPVVGYTGGTSPGGVANVANLIGITNSTISGFDMTGAPIVQFTAGKFYIVPTNTVFDSGTPSTWTGVPGSFAGAVGVFNLAPVEPISQGNVNALLPSTPLNSITLNLAISQGQQSQGRAVFLEDPAFQAYLSNVTQTGLPAGSTVTAEGLFALFNQAVQNSDATAFNLNNTDLGILNALVAASGINTAFSSATLGPGGIYTPGAGAGGTISGDFPTILSADAGPIVQTRLNMVPEPISMAVWGGLMAGGAALGVVRRRRVAKMAA